MATPASSFSQQNNTDTICNTQQISDTTENFALALGVNTNQSNNHPMIGHD